MTLGVRGLSGLVCCWVSQTAVAWSAAIPSSNVIFGSEAEIQGATGMQRDTETEAEAEAKTEVKDLAGRAHGGKDCRPLSRTAEERAVFQ